ncbi:hypothetical protein LAUMK191_02675 [Mycobacterium attenuatum]|nr:hypothetical protein LAUMK191_02675 [Mycobacterium attenuatum]
MVTPVLPSGEQTAPMTTTGAAAADVVVSVSAAAVVDGVVVVEVVEVEVVVGGGVVVVTTEVVVAGELDVVADTARSSSARWNSRSATTIATTSNIASMAGISTAGRISDRLAGGAGVATGRAMVSSASPPPRR